MVRLFGLGGYHIYLFGVMIALGVAAWYFITLSEIKRKKLSLEIFSDLALYSLLFSFIGARLFYVIAFDFGYYFRNPIEILMVRNGGLSIQGGLIGGIVFSYLYLKHKKVNFKNYADAFVPGVAFGQFIGRIGCDVFGIPMKQTYFWGVLSGGQLVHPVQIYEALLDLLLFGILWQRRNLIKFRGQLFCEYIIGFGIIRGGVEFFRINPIWVGSFTVAHFVSLGMIILGLVLYNLFKNKVINNLNKTVENSEVSTIKFWIFILFIGSLGTILFYSIR